jgi:hypothetical protein
MYTQAVRDLPLRPHLILTGWGQQPWRSVERTVGPEATPRALRTWAWRYYGCSPSGALTAFEGETVVAQGIGGEGSRRAGAVCRQF